MEILISDFEKATLRNRNVAAHALSLGRSPAALDKLSAHLNNGRDNRTAAAVGMAEGPVRGRK